MQLFFSDRKILENSQLIVNKQKNLRKNYQLRNTNKSHISNKMTIETLADQEKNSIPA